MVAENKTFLFLYACLLTVGVRAQRRADIHTPTVSFQYPLLHAKKSDTHAPSRSRTTAGQPEKLQVEGASSPFSRLLF